MRKLVIGMSVLAILLIGASVLFAGDKPWFDMENCAFCKNLTAEPGLMDNFKKWEHFNVDNGTITISVVGEGYEDAYMRAIANMDKTAKRMEAGEKLPMCGMCEAYGGLMMEGAVCTDAHSGNIFVSTMTSTNPETVKKIHGYTDKTNAEMKKMEEMQAMEKDKSMKKMEGHEGHGH